jgi:N-acetylmuramoyl-L-alanine amidase
MKIVISSGHGKFVRGASGYIDEVDEARKVVEQTAKELRALGAEVTTYHDDVSISQKENLTRIVDFHNSKVRDLDISVHFNAFETTSKPMGTECLYVTQSALAQAVSDGIADAGGFINRGAKKRTDLFFLNQTAEASILIEVCFVDSEVDVDLYRMDFANICKAIALTLVPEAAEKIEEPEPEPEALFHAKGKVSYFGGPEDTGVDADEGLAFFYEYEDAPHLLLDEQPPGTTGLARRLNVEQPYVACRWDYDVTPKSMLRMIYPALVYAPSTGRQFLAWPADWGPHEDTGRVADISPSLMERLGITTDDAVEVTYPAPWRIKS